jgi:DNA-binding response OmpR family regulator
VPRIFLLEDEPLIAMMLQGWLEEMDCETIGPTHSVQSALDLLQGASLDGALLDVSLQDNKKCYPVASVLRDRRVPFAFLTGYAAEDIDVRFREAPVLCKPLEFEAFRATIAKLLSPRQS